MADCASENNGYTFIWKIENYSMHALPENCCFQSPNFVTSKLNHSKWCLKLYPLGTQNDYLGLEVEKVDGVSEICVELSFFLLTSQGSKHLKTINEKKFNNGATSIVYIEKSSLDSIFEDGSVYTANDTLTLKCHLRSSNVPVIPLETFSCLTEFEVEKHIFDLSFYYAEGSSSNFLYKKCIIPKSQMLPYFKLSICKETPHMRIHPSLSFSLQIFNVNDEYSYKLKIVINIFNSEKMLLDTHSQSKLFFKEETVRFRMLNLNSPYDDSNFPPTTFTVGIDLAISCCKTCSQLSACKKVHDIDNVTACKELKKVMKNPESTQQMLSKSDFRKTFHTGFDSLLDNLNSLLSEKKFCDVTFKIEEKEFLAHKNILSIRSPVFDTMFESDMKERETGVVNIDDIDADTFEYFLKYLYTGKVDLTEENAVHLYSAADKYQVTSLKEECSSFILDHLSAENVCDVLVLSDMHQDEVLKKAAQKVFSVYSKTLLFSRDWVSILEKRPQLAAATLQELTLIMK